ncbi:hypothetical protein SAMN02990966_01185 [Rhodospirillales bacterium URHD0017]|nr:hypothetical protein SAMN02990966_01185 [Rhodospirillales bacterium URHD0017]
MSEKPRESTEGVAEAASAPQQTASRFKEWWKYRQLSINTLAYACFLLLLIIIGGATLVEIISRVSMATFLRSEIVSLQASLAQGGSATAASIVVEPPSPAMTNRGVPIPPTVNPQNEIDLSSVAYRQRRLTEAKIQLAKLNMLSAVGTVGFCESLWFIVHDLRSVITASCHGSYFNPAYGPRDDLLTALTEFRSWSDEALFLALAICSGAIGALIAGLRTVQFTLFRDLSLGIASGFIVYLGMKGGRHVFLLNATEGPTLLNPYAYAFAGILVGLFTERAYALLSSLIDELEHRLRGAVATNPQTTANADGGMATSPPKQPGM